MNSLLNTYAVSSTDRMRHYECRDRVSITLLRANKRTPITDASRQEVITNMAQNSENGYRREGRQRMSLMIGTSLSETMEVASHWSSETHFIIEYRALAATIKVIFMLLVQLQLCKPFNFAYSSVGRAKEFLVP